MNFNPRSLAGATSVTIITLPSLLFQSTLPRGSDQSLICAMTIIFNFNPRSLAGATLNGRLLSDADKISIHAPSRERPSTSALPSPVKLHFNPRSLAGATILYLPYQFHLVFQSTLPRGSDFREAFQIQRWYISIHAPSRERPVFFVSVLAA